MTIGEFKAIVGDGNDDKEMVFGICSESLPVNTVITCGDTVEIAI